MKHVNLVAVLTWALYFVSVILLVQFFFTLSGAGQNEITTVFSTLLIGALLAPLRNRIQDRLDTTGLHEKNRAKVRAK